MGDRLGAVLQAVGVVVAAVSAGLIYIPAGGFVAAVGLVLFGLAVEKD